MLCRCGSHYNHVCHQTLGEMKHTGRFLPHSEMFRSQELGCLKKGKTGRLTTVKELQDMPETQLEPVLVIYNLLLAEEGPTILKLGDIIPLLKIMRRTRPITCLDPILKLVDTVISCRLMLVLQQYCLLPQGSTDSSRVGSQNGLQI